MDRRTVLIIVVAAVILIVAIVNLTPSKVQDTDVQITEVRVDSKTLDLYDETTGTSVSGVAYLEKNSEGRYSITIVTSLKRIGESSLIQFFCNPVFEPKSVEYSNKYGEPLTYINHTVDNRNTAVTFGAVGTYMTIDGSFIIKFEQYSDIPVDENSIELIVYAGAVQMEERVPAVHEVLKFDTSRWAS
ncbi:MAG: hypothetical protein MJZ68_00030 [archaeon]|nr:hypothetical protein [archaeon]